jgi:hypothetical protein
MSDEREIAENETNDFIKRTSNSIKENINGIVRLVDERKAPQAMELSVTEYFEKKLTSVFTPQTAAHYLTVGRFIRKAKEQDVNINIGENTYYSAIKKLVYAFKNIKNAEDRFSKQLEAFEIALQEKKKDIIEESDIVSAIEQLTKEDADFKCEVDEDQEEEDDDMFEALDRAEKNGDSKIKILPIAHNQLPIEELEERCERHLGRIKESEDKLPTNIKKLAQKSVQVDSYHLNMMADIFSTVESMVEEETDTADAIIAITDVAKHTTALLRAVDKLDEPEEEISNVTTNLYQYFYQNVMFQRYESKLTDAKKSKRASKAKANKLKAVSSK